MNGLKSEVGETPSPNHPNQPNQGMSHGPQYDRILQSLMSGANGGEASKTTPQTLVMD